MNLTSLQKKSFHNDLVAVLSSEPGLKLKMSDIPVTEKWTFFKSIPVCRTCFRRNMEVTLALHDHISKKLKSERYNFSHPLNEIRLFSMTYFVNRRKKIFQV